MRLRKPALHLNWPVGHTDSFDDLWASMESEGMINREKTNSNVNYQVGDEDQCAVTPQADTAPVISAGLVLPKDFGNIYLGQKMVCAAALPCLAFLAFSSLAHVLYLLYPYSCISLFREY